MCSLLNNKLSRETIVQIVTESVDIEREFVTESLPVNLIGMNSGFMAEYIEFVADRLLVSLGQDKLYGTANPFPWMEQISLQCAPFPNLPVDAAKGMPCCWNSPVTVLFSV